MSTAFLVSCIQTKIINTAHQQIHLHCHLTSPHLIIHYPKNYTGFIFVVWIFLVIDCFISYLGSYYLKYNSPPPCELKSMIYFFPFTPLITSFFLSFFRFDVSHIFSDSSKTRLYVEIFYELWMAEQNNTEWWCSVRMYL